MSLTLELPEDVVQALHDQARPLGQSTAEYATALLVLAAHSAAGRGPTEQNVELSKRLAALNRIGAYEARVRAGLPPLSDDAIGRDSIYEGRGL